MKNHSVLIIDIKKSRSYSAEERNSLQEYILMVIESLNAVFAGSLAKAVEFSAGDEVQGLFVSPGSAYLYFRMFSMLIHPAEVRAGIGVGEWSIKIENASTTAQDGPVYHNARFAVINTRQTPEYQVLLFSGTQHDLFLNTVINAPFILTGNHSRYQNEIMLLSELLYPICYRQIIDHNSVTSLFKLAKLRTGIYYYNEYYKKSRSNCIFNKIDFIDPKEYVPTNAADEDRSFYVSCGKVRGMATQLSEIIKIRRQGVEKTLKTANIYVARNSAIAALKFMDRYF